MNDIAWAIELQIRRFAMLNDAHDADGLAAMFTAGGSFARPSEPDAPVIGRDNIHAFFRDRPKRVTRHVMANTIVDIISDTEARAHSYVVLYMADKTLVGDFHDRLELHDGIWLFAERRGSLVF
ncbi:nuclear transport factor 2 family protein [Blastomonas sp. AAP53]|uniref:nuclear transport factor 2 family protein n=1 Tax=Blastomonas sp. AAP53 TaxID=1248760 RepID=UPI0002DF98CE|nr:nuclear transport factor 2 family protein [Blastomonas sp. AAP53]